MLQVGHLCPSHHSHHQTGCEPKQQGRVALLLWVPHVRACSNVLGQKEQLNQLFLCLVHVEAAHAAITACPSLDGEPSVSSLHEFANGLTMTEATEN